MLSNDVYDIDFDNLDNAWLAHEIGVSKIEDAYSSVDDNSGFEENSLWIYPNPVKEAKKITISHDLNETQMLDIYIYSAEGSLVKQSTIDYNNTFELDVSSLSSGLYVIRITNGKNIISMKLIVME